MQIHKYESITTKSAQKLVLFFDDIYNHFFENEDGDDIEGFGNLVVIEDGKYEGGQTCFPQFGVGIDVRQGDILFMNVHEFHGNLPIIPIDKDARRMAIVSYLRHDIWKNTKGMTRKKMQEHLNKLRNAIGKSKKTKDKSSTRKYGKNKLAPSISPGKTIEGAAGALLLTTLFAFLFADYFSLPVEISLVYAIIITLFSIFGDLFESYLKRAANLKDSGNIIPGHGGVLDRIDGICASIPIIFSLIIFFPS